jgi:hypothetical protein
MILKGQFVQENYTIRGRRVMVVADMDRNVINVRTFGFNQEYSMGDYTKFDGNMKTFAENKIYGRF